MKRTLNSIGPYFSHKHLKLHQLRIRVYSVKVALLIFGILKTKIQKGLWPRDFSRCYELMLDCPPCERLRWEGTLGWFQMGIIKGTWVQREAEGRRENARNKLPFSQTSVLPARNLVLSNHPKTSSSLREWQTPSKTNHCFCLHKFIKNNISFSLLSICKHRANIFILLHKSGVCCTVGNFLFNCPL